MHCCLLDVLLDQRKAQDSLSFTMQLTFRDQCQCTFLAKISLFDISTLAAECLK